MEPHKDQIGLPAAVVQTTAKRLEPGLIPYHLYDPHERSATDPHPGLKALLFNPATEERADPVRISPTQSLLMIPEQQFHQILDAKDQQISAMEQQKNELLNKVKKLYSVVNLNSIKQSVASMKKKNLKTAITEEQRRRDVAETSLAQLQEEATQVQTKLTQARVQLQDPQRDTKSVLDTEVEKLREQMRLHQSAAEKETAVLYAELQKQNQQHADVSCRISQLEEALRAERTTTAIAETCLAQQVKETARLKASLERVQQDFKDQQHQWKQEESDLLAEQNNAKSIMKTAVMEKRGHLENQRQKWEKEKSSLLATISTLTETIAEEEAEEEHFKDVLMDRITNLEKFLKKKQQNRSLPKKESSRSVEDPERPLRTKTPSVRVSH
ncbi:nuclease SbcCD subunit C-like [Melanotaenia boesemani]|uniref:nuclease SbcCD subunit C-like n=1 Tax=Melanotaenia boesemani TaxID=1250792 RepID=UPI001C053317|nr:nuclease SbcCD subunit C-like [Melanotaenia boesemani]